MTGKIIILNGVSSSGKTSIAKCLQNLLHEPYFHISIDVVLEMAPSQLIGIDPKINEITSKGFYWLTRNNSQAVYLESHTGNIGQAVIDSFFIFIKHVIASGVNVIIDDVIFNEQRLDKYKSLVNEDSVFIIGLTCSIIELEKRELSRSNRRLGEARGQLNYIHKNIKYNLVLDTTNSTPLECATEISKHFQN